MKIININDPLNTNNEEDVRNINVKEKGMSYTIKITKYGDVVLIYPELGFRDTILKSSFIKSFSKNAIFYANKRNLSKFKFGIKNNTTFIIKTSDVEVANTYNYFSAINEVTLAEKIKEYYDSFVSNVIPKYDFDGENYFKSMTFCLICYDLNLIVKKKKEKIVGGSFVELPYYIKKSQCIINIKNKDNKCFLWSILAHLYPQESNANRVTKYKKYEKILDTSNVKWPMCANQFDSFSLINKINFTVFEIQGGDDVDSKDKRLIVLYKQYDEFVKQEPIINILLYKGHYMYIKNLSGLVKCMLQTNKSVYACNHCGESYYYTINAFEKHLLNCPYFEDKKIYKLHDGGKIKFENHYKSLPIPSCIYADFESILEPITKLDVNNQDNSTKLTKHIPCAVGMASWDGSSLNEYYYIGKNGQDCIDKFLDKLVDSGTKMAYRFNTYNLLKLVKSKEKECCICKRKIENGHSYRIESTVNINDVIGSGHEFCRRNYFGQIRQIPVLFHNLKNYDAHLFIDSLSKRFKDLSCIPITKEKYISFKCCFWINGVKIVLRFLDTIGFLSGSLASNASTLNSFKFIGKVKSNIEWNNIENVDNKLPFPYEYIKSFDVLNEPFLPTNTSDWYSELKGSSPDIKSIELAIKTFNDNNCKNIGDYMLLYLRIDVLLLLEIFESFRVLSMNEYTLDPLHYYTTPGLAWDAALKFTNVELDILENDEMVGFFIQKGVIRGGISTVSELKYASSDCINSNIMYYDVTNLYGYAMISSLPTGNFKFLNFHGDESINAINTTLNILKNYSDDDNIGYMFEVDMHYPNDLISIHNALPFLVERVNGKLIPTINDKTNYRLHISILIQAINNGLVLTRVHKIISFSQSKWLSNYIMHNTNERAKTKDANKRNFYKLMNNSVYGKTMENILNRSKFIIYDLATFNNKMLKNDFRNKIKKITQLTSNIIVSEENDMIPVYDKPIYIGFSILEISKRHMYDLLYNVIKPKWKTSKLMYMDTDSLILYINEKMDYNGVENYFDLNSKGILGTLKDEYPNDPITKFICLKSKCYLLENKSGKRTVKNKGVGDTSGLDLKDFEEMLNAEINKEYIFKKTSQVNFRSINHEVFTIKCEKISLTSIDDKRNPPNIDYTTTPLLFPKLCTN